ncbi:MAG: glycoside hydrolase family 28 protein [Cyclobacteriaceae bacterium]|nr:glycoside hydrolase family 28 protein [Cyclobacteriaceae bacterium]
MKSLDDIFLKLIRVLPVFIALLYTENVCSAKLITDNPPVNISQFGAKGDGLFLNTQIIQKAIDEVSAKGGGKIVFSEGTYLTGSIQLKSGVELHLQHGALILGSLNPFDYIHQKKYHGLIDADKADNIGISGDGTINGQGQKLALIIDSLYHAGFLTEFGYNYRRKRPDARPKLIDFKESNNIVLQGVTLKNSANWVVNFDLCQDISIDRITVDSDDYWNNDGIDLGDCRNVRITNSFVNAADDGICLKSHHKGAMNENIYIANCTIRSSASAIKFGTASYGGFKNVKIENIYIYDTFRSAIALESVDGGILEDIDISNIKANNTGNAIFIKLGHRNTDGAVGTLKNISIRDVVVQVPFEAPDLKYKIRGPQLAFFHNVFPASITGLPGHYVENVHIEDVIITYPGRANKGYAYIPLYRLDDVPENADAYPEFHMFGELPSWGLYVRHVKGLTMKNIQLKVLEDDFRPAMVFDDVGNLFLDKIWIRPTNASDQIILKDVKKEEIGKVQISTIKGKGVRKVK